MDADSESRPPRIGRLVIRVLIFIVVMFVGGALFLPPPTRPNLAIHVAGYTNDSSGTRLALISITNNSPTTVFAYAPRAVIHDASAPIGLAYMRGPPWSANMTPSASGNFLLPVPTNDAAWRFSILVYNDLDFGRRIKCYLTLRRQMPFKIETDWFE